MPARDTGPFYPMVGEEPSSWEMEQGLAKADR